MATIPRRDLHGKFYNILIDMFREHGIYLQSFAVDIHETTDVGVGVGRIRLHAVLSSPQLSDLYVSHIILDSEYEYGNPRYMDYVYRKMCLLLVEGARKQLMGKIVSENRSVEYFDLSFPQKLKVEPKSAPEPKKKKYYPRMIRVEK